MKSIIIKTKSDAAKHLIRYKGYCVFEMACGMCPAVVDFCIKKDCFDTDDNNKERFLLAKRFLKKIKQQKKFLKDWKIIK